MEDIEISLVIPVYNEEVLLEELFQRLQKSLPPLGLDYEIIFIDDGSSDRSPAILSTFVKSDPRVKVISFSRNFGQQAAYSAGLDHMNGKAAILMDADLQDDPETIPKFVEEWRSGQYDVIYAIRKDRKERTSKRWAYTVFYKLLSFLAHSPIPRDAGDFCLLDRKVVEQFRRMPECHRFLRGMRGWLGFRQLGIPVIRNERFAGKPKYTLPKLVRLALDGLMTSSTLPLRAISVLGVLLAAVAVILGLYYLYAKVTSGIGPPGFATIVVIVCFFSGVQLIVVGVVAEYVGRIFEQVRGRPTYVVREVQSRSERNS